MEENNMNNNFSNMNLEFPIVTNTIVIHHSDSYFDN